MTTARQRETQTRKYLGGAALSRPLFKILFEAAEAMIPPAEDCGDESMPLECRLTVQEMSEKLGVSRTTVLRDLRRLENFGWVGRAKGTVRLLGHRRGTTYHLIADLQAEQKTGEERLVSRRVLELRERPKTKPVGRGLARRWIADGA